MAIANLDAIKKNFKSFQELDAKDVKVEEEVVFQKSRKYFFDPEKNGGEKKTLIMLIRFIPNIHKLLEGVPAEEVDNIVSHQRFGIKKLDGANWINYMSPRSIGERCEVSGLNWPLIEKVEGTDPARPYKNPAWGKYAKDHIQWKNPSMAMFQVVGFAGDKEMVNEIFESDLPKELKELIKSAQNPSEEDIANGDEPKKVFDLFEAPVLKVKCTVGTGRREWTGTTWTPKTAPIMIPPFGDRKKAIKFDGSDESYKALIEYFTDENAPSVEKYRYVPETEEKTAEVIELVTKHVAIAKGEIAAVSGVANSPQEAGVANSPQEDTKTAPATAPTESAPTSGVGSSPSGGNADDDAVFDEIMS